MRSLLAKPAFRIAAMIVIGMAVTVAARICSDREAEDHSAWMRDRFDLSAIKNVYRVYQEEFGKPLSQEELLERLKPELAQRICNGELVIRWGTNFTGDASIVVGHSTIRTRRGYVVLMGDGISREVQDLPAN